jgi:hypothetical protein
VLTRKNEKLRHCERSVAVQPSWIAALRSQ